VTASDSAMRALVAAQRWPDLEGARFSVIGLGLSGISAANALVRAGADVLASDARPVEALGAAAQKLDARVQVRVGERCRPGDLCVISPGVAPHTKTFADALDAASLLLSEMELFFRLDGGRHPVLAVTGTDGKTTTTMLLGAMVQRAGLPACVGGNIGRPLCDVFWDPDAALAPESVIVAEVSGFQTVTNHLFRPRVGILTNISEDHLDHFSGTMPLPWLARHERPLDRYGEAKWRLASRMGAGDSLVANADYAPIAARLSMPRACATIAFSIQSPPSFGAPWHLDGDDLVGPEGALTARSRLRMVGRHNAANVLAASAAAHAFGVPVQAIRAAAEEFDPPHHRIERVASGPGVSYYDDSKATTPHAVLTALRAFDDPATGLVWIGGGGEKDAAFDALGEALAARAEVAIVLWDDTRPLPAEARCRPSGPRLLAAIAPRVRTLHARGLAEAVDLATREAEALRARRPDVREVAVLLSPACTSYDLFANYEERGRAFTGLARAKVRSISP